MMADDKKKKPTPRNKRDRTTAIRAVQSNNSKNRNIDRAGRRVGRQNAAHERAQRAKDTTQAAQQRAANKPTGKGCVITAVGGAGALALAVVRWRGWV